MGKLKKILRKWYGRWIWLQIEAKILPWKVKYAFSKIQNNKVVFLCYNGKNYSCNPKYITEEILRKGYDWDLVWLLRDIKEPVPEGIRKVAFDSHEALKELATAKVIITNTKNDLRLIKKKGQFVIHTWHSSFECKKLEREVADKLPERYVWESKRNSRQTDLFLSNSAAMTQYYRDAFWCESEILECGYPRNDILFSFDPALPGQVREKLGLPENSRLVLYAPTFRDDNSSDAFDINCEGILKALQHTGENWYLLIRMHPNIPVPEGQFRFTDRVRNASPYPDMQELLLASDILITDYSSTVYEFAVLGKPSYIYASDVERYQQIRGLNDCFFQMPYPICRTNEALLALMEQYTPESGREAAKEFLRKFGSVDRGDASSQVVERIRREMES